MNETLFVFMFKCPLRKCRNILSAETLLFIYVFISSQCINAQSPSVIPFDSSHWNIQAKEITMENFQGKQCLKIIDGAAYLKDNFENGIVEFDISFDKERCFPGLMFHIVDDIQYCPIIYGNDLWQLYTGKG